MGIKKDMQLDKILRKTQVLSFNIVKIIYILAIVFAYDIMLNLSTVLCSRAN